MPNVVFHALCKFWNELPDVVCEQVFLPDAEELREYQRTGLPFLTLESQLPVCDFDILALSITFEPDELNLVRMLELARIPARPRSRRTTPSGRSRGPITFLIPSPCRLSRP